MRVFDVFINKYAPEEEKAGRLTFIKGDLLNAADVEAAAKGCLAIFHVASPSPLSKNPKLFFDVNVNGTKNVLQVARALGTKLDTAPAHSLCLSRHQSLCVHEQRLRGQFPSR